MVIMDFCANSRTKNFVVQWWDNRKDIETSHRPGFRELLELTIKYGRMCQSFKTVPRYCKKCKGVDRAWCQPWKSCQNSSRRAGFLLKRLEAGLPLLCQSSHSHTAHKWCWKLCWDGITITKSRGSALLPQGHHGRNDGEAYKIKKYLVFYMPCTALRMWQQLGNC